MTKWIRVEAHSDSLSRQLEARDGALILDRGGAGHLWGFSAPRSAVVPTAHSFVTSALTATAAVQSSLEFVDVIGDGLLAALIRLVLGDRNQPDSASVTIDTTGDPDLIARAAVDLPRRGALLLAAPANAEDVMMRTYADIHVKALSVIGVRWSGPGSEASRELVNFALENLVYLDVPTIPSHGLWYCLEHK